MWNYYNHSVTMIKWLHQKTHFNLTFYTIFCLFSEELSTSVLQNARSGCEVFSRLQVATMHLHEPEWLPMVVSGSNFVVCLFHFIFRTWLRPCLYFRWHYGSLNPIHFQHIIIMDMFLQKYVGGISKLTQICTKLLLNLINMLFEFTMSYNGLMRKQISDIDK